MVNEGGGDLPRTPPPESKGDAYGVTHLKPS